LTGLGAVVVRGIAVGCGGAATRAGAEKVIQAVEFCRLLGLGRGDLGLGRCCLYD
jgi:hypothetical protein